MLLKSKQVIQFYCLSFLNFQVIFNPNSNVYFKNEQSLKISKNSFFFF